MKYGNLFLFLFLTCITGLYSQQMLDAVTLEDSANRFIVPESGLYLREKPDRKSKPVFLIPFNSRIQILDRKFEYLEIDEHYGYWAKVKFKKYVGWSFSGYFSNEVRPQPNLRHWNQKKEKYFVLSAEDSKKDCANLYDNQSCKLEVYSKDGVLISRFAAAASSAGWRKESLVISTYAADGAGGGIDQKLWNPVSNTVTFYYSSGFINNSLEQEEPGAAYTYFLCKYSKCFFIDDDEEKKIGSLHSGYHGKEGCVKDRFIRNYKYKNKIELSLGNDKFFIVLDGVEVEIKEHL